MDKLRLVALSVLLAPCGDGSDGPRAYEVDDTCDVVSADRLEDGDVTPFGPTVAELFGPVLGDHEATLSYADGGMTTLSLQVTATDEPVLLVDQRAEPTIEPGWCRTEVQRRALLELATADGRFAESIEVVLRAYNPVVRGSAHLPASSLRGTDVPPAEVEGADRIWYLVTAQFGSGSTLGSIDVAGESVDGTSVSLRQVPVGQFAGAPVE